MTPDSSVPPTLVTAPEITLVAWHDHRMQTHIFDLRSSYVERFWLATLGPATTWFLRRCADMLDEAVATRVNLHETARSLGIGHQGGTRSAMAKTIARACRFRAARPTAPTTLAVRTSLPMLSRRQLDRLPKSVQREHGLLVPPDAEAVQQRARHLATYLIGTGHTITQTQKQLATLDIHPALTTQETTRAWHHHRSEGSSEAA